MAKIRRVSCDVPNCTNLVTHGTCLMHQEQIRRENIETLGNLFEAKKKLLGLPESWGCLNPNCEICS
jgi:hypothetical protein